MDSASSNESEFNNHVLQRLMEPAKMTGRTLRAHTDNIAINCASGEYCPLRYTESQKVDAMMAKCSRCTKPFHDNCGGGEVDKKICARCRIKFKFDIPFPYIGSLWALVDN